MRICYGLFHNEFSEKLRTCKQNFGGDAQFELKMVNRFDVFNTEPTGDSDAAGGRSAPMRLEDPEVNDSDAQASATASASAATSTSAPVLPAWRQAFRQRNRSA